MNTTIVIERVEQIRNSANGNPRYRVHLQGGSALNTAADSAVNFGIGNSDMIGVPLSARLNGKGEIVRVEQQA